MKSMIGNDNEERNATDVYPYQETQYASIEEKEEKLKCVLY